MLDYVFLAFFLQEHHLINCRSGSRESTNSHDFGTDIGWWFNLYCHKRSCFFHVWHLQTLIKLEVLRHLFSRHRHGNFPHLQASQHTPDQSCVSCQFPGGFSMDFSLPSISCFWLVTTLLFTQMNCQYSNSSHGWKNDITYTLHQSTVTLLQLKASQPPHFSNCSQLVLFGWSASSRWSASVLGFCVLLFGDYLQHSCPFQAHELHPMPTTTWSCMGFWERSETTKNDKTQTGCTKTSESMGELQSLCN